MVDFAPNRDYNKATVKENTKDFPETGQRIKQNVDSPAQLTSLKRKAHCERQPLARMNNKEDADMKIQYRYEFSGDWHDYKEADSTYEAKQIAKKLKKHIGSCGKVRIVNV